MVLPDVSLKATSSNLEENFGLALPTGSENRLEYVNKQTYSPAWTMKRVPLNLPCQTCLGYLKPGRGNPWAGHNRVNWLCVSVLKEDVSDFEENLGFAPPIGS